MSIARSKVTVGIIGGKLYVVGGFNGSSLSVVEVYDPTTDSWTLGPRIQTARHGAVAGVIDGKLYIAGGQNQSGYLNVIEVFETRPRY